MQEIIKQFLDIINNAEEVRGLSIDIGANNTMTIKLDYCRFTSNEEKPSNLTNPEGLQTYPKSVPVNPWPSTTGVPYWSNLEPNTTFKDQDAYKYESISSDPNQPVNELVNCEKYGHADACSASASDNPNITTELISGIKIEPNAVANTCEPGNNVTRMVNY
jgi:hypothetical protein